MRNIGIDFGSTYTTVSVYREETGLLETVFFNQDSPYVPSVAAYNGKKLEFGRAAKLHAGKKGVSVYKAFKMLLTETDEERLEKRGYLGPYTPSRIAGEFLDDLIHQVLARTGEERIGRLVVGAPEIWFQEVKTIAARSILRDICLEIPEVGSVQVVSEPAAASAFFSYNYQTITGKAFDGNILLIDYGGGTLDLTLTQVTARPDEENRQRMEIKVLEAVGAGENVERRIGKAGIVYMEVVMAEAVWRAGLVEGDRGPKIDGKFLRAVNELEDELQSRTEEIGAFFAERGLEDPDRLNEEFTSVDYRGEELEITYGLLAEVYDDVIRPVLDGKLREMLSFMDEWGIDYGNSSRDTFKVALVGGFGNFYLVKKQVMDLFRFVPGDRRQSDIIRNKSDCEKAISLGTALLASRVVGIRQTAPYSIGVFARSASGEACRDYAFRYKEDIEFGRAYFPVSPADGRRIVTFVASNSISRFVINMGHDEQTAIVVPLKEEFKRRLENVVKNEYRTAVIGFSLDPSEVVSVHICEYDLLEDQLGEDHVIELTRFDELFELTRVEKLEARNCEAAKL